jgi:hypothetical protein
MLSMMYPGVGGSQFGVQRSFLEFKPDVATRLADGDHNKTGIAQGDKNANSYAVEDKPVVKGAELD